MPKILIPGPLHVSFYSADCAEKMHVHVRVGSGSCKVWIDSWTATQIKGLNKSQVGKLIKVLKIHEETIRGRWDEHCCK